MSSQGNDYALISQWKKEAFSEDMGIHSINCMFDRLLTRVMEDALTKMLPQQPPCSFAWFTMGSSGRYEQTFTSDQDHALIYKEEGHELFFLALGQHLADALHFLGYMYCPGKVMSNNVQWCRSANAWTEQILQWQQSDHIKAIRYLQIVLDARFIYGEASLVAMLRQQLLTGDRQVIENLAMNMSLIKRGLTPVGAFVVERVGPYRGMLDFKNTIYIPYVNSIRLLSVLEGIDDTMTKQRIQKLQPKYRALFKNYQQQYDIIMGYRMNEKSFIDIKKADKKELKELIRYVKKLHDYAINRIGIRC
ncbi:DUF294 nucleotidyltransferase-like domain-containing protein [Kurthia sibirica]|uniref:CBS domain-containing protein n=1 Tax=Kurthia sibirica TaxID=202750 RepID=A0A2U3AIL2_9BACL|nr:DUF294 nucleotidyltransferase-like domain-containing protein [Kurthia sibirica]PWI24375.1 hypothetical protein DEX24_13645 [Kurthia sibirica]GEK33792.1 hypothetical protein KSI01_13250 [Kurthia sibirica]